jgi:hypothetical protein
MHAQARADQRRYSMHTHDSTVVQCNTSKNKASLKDRRPPFHNICIQSSKEICRGTGKRGWGAESGDRLFVVSRHREVCDDDKLEIETEVVRLQQLVLYRG